jgi:uncharacterized OsmC-like protein
MIATVTYSGDLRTHAVHLLSNTSIRTDAPTDNQGLGEAFSPTDLLATALASCMLTIMGISARNHHLLIDGATAHVKKSMAANPRRVSQIDIEINMPPMPFSQTQRQILETAAKTCPVALSLHPDIIQNLSFNWQDL